jgi:Xaa-Pro aminopeptidase
VPCWVLFIFTKEIGYMPDENAGWDNYSKLVLQQLEGLAKSIDALREEFHDIKDQLTELKAKEDRVQDLKAWKERVDEVMSPTQLQQAMKDVEELKMFKTKAITVFAVAQFFMAFFAWAIKFVE